MADLMSAADADLLRESVRAAFAGLSRSEHVRAAMATPRGWDATVWRRLAGELGLPGLLLAPELGGGGFTTAELGLVFEEAGAALLCAPLFSTAGLAVPLLLALDDPAALAEFGPPICAGTLTATVALAEDDGRWRPDAVTTVARAAGSHWRLDGVKNYVVDGAHADLVLVVARTPGDLGVFAVTADADGLGREQLVTLDQTRKQARLVLTDTPGRLIATTSSGPAIDRATAVSRILLAAEQAGGAKQVLDRTVEYAKTRIQFARPIGSFQAVKQRLAEMLIQVESARSAAAAAARIASTAALELPSAAAIAALTCTEAYTWVTAQSIQLHGGIGFTWEHDAHLYFKRARSSAQLLGSPAEHVARLAAWLDSVDV